MRAGSIVAIASLILVFPRAAQSQPGNRPVSLYVDVEEGGNLVKGLNADNFRLYQDDHARNFKLESPETPMDIAVLLEYGASSLNYIDDIQYALQGFLEAAPEGNWYAAATYSRDTSVLVDFTREVGRLRVAFSDLGQPV